MDEELSVYLLKRLKRALARFKVVFRLPFLTFLLALFTLYFFLAFKGVRTEGQNEINKLRESVASYERRYNELLEKEKQNLLPPPKDPLEGARVCETTESAILTGDSEFAACLEEDRYDIYRKYQDRNGQTHYVALSEETGRVTQDDELFISYSGNYDFDYLKDPGSMVFQVNPARRNLSILVDALSIPNKELFIDRQWWYTPIYNVQFNPEGMQWSPNGRYMLLLVHDCWGCEGNTWLYAYDFLEKDLQYIGSPYVEPDEEKGRAISIEWGDETRLHWREGRWRERKEEEYESSDYPVVQDDLGFKTVVL